VGVISKCPRIGAGVFCGPPTLSWPWTVALPLAANVPARTSMRPSAFTVSAPVPALKRAVLVTVIVPPPVPAAGPTVVLPPTE
jgi:hypothetical protein